MSGAGLGSPYRFLGASGGTTAHTGGAPPDHSLPQHPRAAYWQTLVDLAQTREWGGGAGAGGGGGGAQQQQPQPQRSTSAVMSEALAAAYGAGAAGGDSAPGSSDLHQHHHPLLGAVGNHDYQQRLAATLSNLGYGGGGGNAPPTSQQALQSNESLLLAMEVLKQQQQQDGPISSSSSSSANAFLAQQSQGGPSRNDVLEALQRLEQQQQQPQQSTNAASVISEAHAALRNSAPSASGTGALLGRAALKEALEASATMDYATGSSGGGALASDRALALEIYRQQQQLQQLNQQQHQQQHNDQSRAGLLASARGGATNSDVLQTLRLLGQQQQQQQQQQAAGLRDIPDVAASSSSSLDFGASAGGMSSLERSLALEFLQQKQQQQHQLQQLQLQEQSRSMASASALAAQRARLLGGGGGGLGPTAANGSDLYAALQLMGQSRVASGGSSSTADALAAALDGGRLAQVRRVDPAHAVASSSMVRSSGSASHNHRAASERASLDLSLCKTSSDTVRVLKVLGSTIRSKDDPFVDVDALPDLKHPYSEYKAPICGDLLFPDKLHILLEDAEREGFADVVSWLPHRRAFRVHNKARFLSDVMPRHFKGKGVWSSFRRQLNLYGFARTKKGIDAGSYYHELFLQGRKELSQCVSSLNGFLTVGVFATALSYSVRFFCRCFMTDSCFGWDGPVLASTVAPAASSSKGTTPTFTASRRCERGRCQRRRKVPLPPHPLAVAPPHRLWQRLRPASLPPGRWRRGWRHRTTTTIMTTIMKMMTMTTPAETGRLTERGESRVESNNWSPPRAVTLASSRERENTVRQRKRGKHTNMERFCAKPIFTSKAYY